jgi:isocitrate dehydrogenase
LEGFGGKTIFLPPFRRTTMKKIAVLAGDGIGPEIMDEAIKVVNKLL